MLLSMHIYLHILRTPTRVDSVIYVRKPFPSPVTCEYIYGFTVVKNRFVVTYVKRRFVRPRNCRITYGSTLEISHINVNYARSPSHKEVPWRTTSVSIPENDRFNALCVSGHIPMPLNFVGIFKLTPVEVRTNATCVKRYLPQMLSFECIWRDTVGQGSTSASCVIRHFSRAVNSRDIFGITRENDLTRAICVRSLFVIVLVWHHIVKVLMLVPLYLYHEHVIDTPAMIQIMAWRRAGDKPLSESIMAMFTDACIWWVETNILWHIHTICSMSARVSVK